MSGCGSRAAANRNSAERFAASLSSTSIGNRKNRVAFRIVSRPNTSAGYYRLKGASRQEFVSQQFPQGGLCSGPEDRKERGKLPALTTFGALELALPFACLMKY